MQINAGTLRRALKIFVRLEPKQPMRPMLEHVLFEPTQNDDALTGTDITADRDRDGDDLAIHLVN